MTARDASQVRPGLTRRDVLKLAAATSLAPWLSPACSRMRPLPALLRSRGPLPPRFATPLPIPPALAVTREADGSDRCTLTLREGTQQILPDRTTLVWGGDGMFPCPTVEARRGRRLVLHLRNELPVPTVMHLHGGKTPAASDGYPTDLVLPAHGGFPTHVHMPDPLARVAHGDREYEYPNDQRAATLWYHDHRMDFTGPQVWRGLSGLYLLRDDEEEALPLPRGAREVPLVMCDRSFDEDGSFLYPALDPTLRERPGVVPAFMGGVPRKTLEQATAFVREKGIVTLPPRSNLQVIETPEFMRGIYGVGGFNSAPPLQPELGAFYWVTPIPKTWPKARIESKLREYNDYGIQQLTIHEAMPGHWLQQEVANDVQPASRRVLRSVFANTPYVEGWGVYSQQLMSEQGYLNDRKALRLTMLKQKLRGLANAILDIRLQTMGMTDQQALDLMIKDTFQEREEATAKLQRAQLSSCQLPTYYAGLKGWLQLRERYKQARGAAFSQREFHDRALAKSGIPLPQLEKLLLR